MIPHKNYRTRIGKVKQLLEKEPNRAALLLSSATLSRRSWDTTYRYRQDSDFYYLTGSTIQNATLLIISGAKESYLIAAPRSKHAAIWDGEEEKIEAVAKKIGVTPITSTDPIKEIFAKLNRIEKLYFQNNPASTSFKVAEKLFSTPPFHANYLPRHFAHATLITSKLRLFKEPAELEVMKRASAITIAGVLEGISNCSAGSYESDVATAIESCFRVCGAEVAFETIAASGKSAATLHYVKCDKVIKRNEMFLIDCGAEYQYYAGDITRAIPVSGTFTKNEAIIYDAVLTAQKAAIKTIRDGVKIQKVYDAAAVELIEGLKKLKILKGSTTTLLKKGAHKEYFPHGIGHSLGIDVHDVGDLRGNNEPTLRAGMVFTVEPGLYFRKKIGLASASGVRIEDDVLVTKKGCEVLTKDLPKEREEIEALTK